MKGLKISSEGTHVSVIIYSTEVEACFTLTTYLSVDDLEPVVFNLEYMAGVTNTADGIMVMHQMLKDQGRGSDIATPIGVVITDGVSNVDESRTIPEADLAKADGIQMFAVAIGDNEINMDEIKGIATNDDYVFHATTYGEVQDLTDTIAAMICKISISYHEECGECGQFGECDADQCNVPGSKEGTKECWEVRDSDGVERENSRKTVPCTEPCSITCVEVCDDECGNLGPCSESCGADGITKGTKECWTVNGDTRVEIPSSRHTVDCDETCFNKCPVEVCDDECGNFGPCSESCGADGIMKGTKECWLVDADTRVELPRQ
ncbi:hypothetical protein NP493_373g02048 [Ridgeia piscesae]|uniref:VWFA domain-containing protein n=1 Tax=Ridgeia piscesae TaxID=27915 RepID=A0AAD9NVX9_RIDPI|nr:hypothetical protein NP493_373g02048 [Ridgeia piscesae]